MSENLKMDLQQVLMVAAHFYNGLQPHRITCEAFAHRLPPERRFLFVAGTEQIKEFLLNQKFTADDIKLLREVPEIKSVMDVTNFETFLKDFRFKGDFWSMAEGEVAFAGEPFVRITGTIPEVCLAESFILSVLNHDVRVASKAARIVLAANGKPVYESASRRTHHSAAIDVAKAAYLAGFAGTSNLEAHRLYNIPLRGTMSHAWVLIRANEKESFNDFKNAFDYDLSLPIDTFDPINGVQLASEISYLKEVCIDSGDLFLVAQSVRNILNNNKRHSVKIIASGYLNEYDIDNLSRNSLVDEFVVGSDLIFQKDAPSLGIVYKPVFNDTIERPIIQLSEDKVFLPGKKQVYLDQRDGSWSHLISICDIDDLMPLLDCHIKDGKLLSDFSTLNAARSYCNTSLKTLPREFLSLVPAKKAKSPVVAHQSIWQSFKEAKY